MATYVGKHGNKIDNVVQMLVYPDYEVGERCGAGGNFQLIDVTLITSDEKEHNITNDTDQGQHYTNLEEVKKDLHLTNIDADFV